MIYLVCSVIALVASVIMYQSINETSPKKLLRSPRLILHIHKGTLYQLAVLFVSELVIFNALAARMLTDYSTIQIVLFVIITVFFSLLVYLSVFDLIYLEIPFYLSLGLVIAAIIFNFLILLLYNGQLTVWPGHELTATSDIIGGIAAGGAIGLIVLATRERGMGKGDIYLATIMGLLLGFTLKLAIGAYIAIFSATFIGLSFAFIKKQLKGLKLPFVPFISAAVIISFIFGAELQNLVFRLLFRF